jgi:hypothetical protein
VTGVTKSKKVLVDREYLKFLLDVAEAHFRKRRSEEDQEWRNVFMMQALRGLSIQSLWRAQRLRREMPSTKALLDFVRALRRYYLAKDPTKLVRLVARWRKEREARG